MDYRMLDSGYWSLVAGPWLPDSACCTLLLKALNGFHPAIYQKLQPEGKY
jgi:hypothetical protein